MCKFPTSASRPTNLVLLKTISATNYPVLLAVSPVDSTELVVKAFTKDVSSQSAYLKEKEVLSSISHPNIIQSIPNTKYSVKIPNANHLFLEYAPHGDFFNLMATKNFSNEKLVRTYFHQLIEGLEHLHLHGLAHLDIKLENLLLGKDLRLKIADFDVTQNCNDEEILSEGTENYRAPEIRIGECKDPRAADIYSAGVCLFALLSKAFPFVEDQEEVNIKPQRYDQFLVNNNLFWREFEALVNHSVSYSEDLKQLVNGMLQEEPQQRFNLDKVKQSNWYNESIYSEKEINKIMNKVLAC